MLELLFPPDILRALLLQMISNFILTYIYSAIATGISLAAIPNGLLISPLNLQEAQLSLVLAITHTHQHSLSSVHSLLGKHQMYWRSLNSDLVNPTEFLLTDKRKSWTTEAPYQQIYHSSFRGTFWFFSPFHPPPSIQKINHGRNA